MTETDAGGLDERRDGPVVTLTFDRPEVRNAFDPALMGAVTDAARRLATDDQVRVVVLTGSGTAFSAGADLTWMASTGHHAATQDPDDPRRFDAMLRAVHDLPMPVVARVNGHALGGAVGLLGCADLAVAVRGARFGFTEVRLGLAPAMISVYVLPRLGLANAQRYLLTGERFDSDRALHLGLVDEVCDADDLDAVVGRFLEELLAGGPSAQREIKALLGAIGGTPDLDVSLEARLELIARLRASEEGQEGVRAFLERRRPSWGPGRDDDRRA